MKPNILTCAVIFKLGFTEFYEISRGIKHGRLSGSLAKYLRLIETEFFLQNSVSSDNLIGFKNSQRIGGMPDVFSEKTTVGAISRSRPRVPKTALFHRTLVGGISRSRPADYSILIPFL